MENWYGGGTNGSRTLLFQTKPEMTAMWIRVLRREEEVVRRVRFRNPQ